MNTSRSTKLVQEFLAKEHPFKRKVQTYKKQFSAKPEVVFPQLCPAREADWIDGWVTDLVYTTSGYAEADCIFTTPESNVLGAGLWIFTQFDPNKVLELVVIHTNSVVEHVRIELIDHGDGTCEGIWTLRFTAINEEGNKVVEAMPDQDPEFFVVLDGLEHFLTTGDGPTAKRPPSEA